MAQRAAIYCRVSTDDQSCARQRRDLEAFAKRAGYQVVGVFTEKASGADNTQVAVARLLTQRPARRF
jgi:putative DNA-invertase from lambdoid prophage Rac